MTLPPTNHITLTPHPSCNCVSLSVALPFGGFGRSAKLPAPAPKDTPFSHGLSPEPPASETITLRPTFNRTALGWISDGAPLVLPEIPLDPIDPNFIPESEDL